MKILSKLPPYLLSLLVVAAILYLTLVPRPLPDNNLMLIPHLDKLVHACMFGGLVIVMAADYLRHRRHHRLTTAVVVVMAVVSTVFGGVIELMQGWMEMGRGADPFDLLADGVGATVAAVVCRLVWKRRSEKSRDGEVDGMGGGTAE